MPTEQRVREAIKLMRKRAANHDYFFDQLGSPDWIEPLREMPAEGWENWSLFTLSATSAERPAPPARLVLLPTTPKVQESAAIEEIGLIRDEMAAYLRQIQTLRLPAEWTEHSPRAPIVIEDGPCHPPPSVGVKICR